MPCSCPSAGPPSPGPGSPAPAPGITPPTRRTITWICSSAVDTCCIVELVDVREVEDDRVVFCCELLFTCLLFSTAPPPPLPKGMQGLADGSTRFPPVLIPDPLRSDVDALLSFHDPLGTSLVSLAALLPAVPLLTLRLPVLRYMLPSLLPTA